MTHNFLQNTSEVKRSIRVLLIQAPAEGGVRSLLPQIEEGSEGIGFKPPIGLLYLATTITQFSHHAIKVLDCIAMKMDLETAVHESVAYQPDLIGISAWTDFWFPAYTLGKMLKESLPAVHLVYGGPHVSIYPHETLGLPFVDSIIVGDGETPFLRLCNMVANEEIENDFPGLHLKEGGVKEGQKTFYIQKDLDALPLPDRRLLPTHLYSSVLSKSDHVTTMITSRGCPFRCTFCKLHFQKCLSRSASSVIEEFRQIRDMGIREVEVYDDTFTWSKQRVIDICQGLIDAGIHVEWAIRDRVSNADPALLELLYQAGCRRVHYGVESGVDRVIARMKKGITTEEARNAVAWAKQAGMTVLTYFMFGNIDETVEDMKRTIDFALELNSDYAEFSITIPYPGTEMYQEALASGLIQTDYWKDYALNPVSSFLPPQLIENYADLATLRSLRDEAVRHFYFRPRYLFRQITAVRSLQEFLRKANMGLRLLLNSLKKGA